ncbi:prevent-host-death protein [Oleomonas cavernae]|uniref:Prevent-host-death protein n=1 Tax=Oleomonas cavernae TaxID=2320859 RepID=A0A418WIT2_9PROT|nr:prevent-host-death protein [Oleomonas cavernae]RJF89779.1 prevent-host-death protein [Oleomonas cavernae]
MTTVDIREAISNLSRLIAALEAGDESEIVIARDGQPAARLLPPAMATSQNLNKRIGLLEGKFAAPLDLDADDEELLRLFNGK